jgi:WXG100 family type VII secretion target
MSAAAAEVDTLLARLAGAIAPVRAEWVGAAQAQFEALWDRLQRDASGVRSVLTGIATLTQNAAVAYAATEQSIAKSFDEFRIERDMVHVIDGVFGELAAPSGEGDD